MGGAFFFAFWRIGLGGMELCVLESSVDYQYIESRCSVADKKNEEYWKKKGSWYCIILNYTIALYQ